MLRYGQRSDGLGGIAPEIDPAGAVGPTSLPDPVAGVTAALVGLAAVNGYLTGSGEDDLADADMLATVLVGLGHLDAAITAARARTIVAVEDAGLALAAGAASATAWVADRLRLSASEAARECRLASRLDGLPGVLADLERGIISRDHAGQLVAASVQQQQDHDAAERARRAAQDQARRDRDAAAARAAAHARDEAHRSELQAAAAQAEQVRRQAEAAEQAARRAAAEQARQRRLAELQARAASGASPDEVREDAQQQRAADPDAMARHAAAQLHRRSVRSWTDRDSGMGMIRAALPVDAYEAYQTAIAATRTFDPPETPIAERRSSEQREADAFIDVIDAALKAGELPTCGGVKPHVTAYAPAETLLGTADQVGTGRFGSTLAADMIRRLACDSGIVRALTGATAQVLDVGRETRVWSVAQRRAVELRDGGCRFPVAEGVNCGRPMGWSDIHHVTWWRHGGDTATDNGILLCGHHHRAVHHDGWDLSFDAATGEVTATRRVNGHPSLTRTSPPRPPNPPPQPDPGPLQDSQPPRPLTAQPCLPLDQQAPGRQRQPA